MPSRLDVEVNGFNGGVLNGVPSAYHWYTEQVWREVAVWGSEVKYQQSERQLHSGGVLTRRGVSQKATLLQN
ncbi:yfdA [Escherichia coli DEC11C]|nr:yfdA [Escherichia coli DEC11C]